MRQLFRIRSPKDRLKPLLALIAGGLFFLGSSCNNISQKDAANELPPDHSVMTDMLGRTVRLPNHPVRVIDMSDGFISGVMTVLGESDKIAALGSHCVMKNFRYTYPTTTGETYTYANGMNPVGVLNPQFAQMPLLATYGQATNYEALAALNPDLVILRLGACYADDQGGKEALAKKIRTIEALGIPLFILKGPPAFDRPGIANISEEIHLLGKIFHQEEKAGAIALYLESTVQMIRERTQDVPAAERPRVLMLGLSPKARGSGAAGTAHGAGTIESYFIEQIIHATNAYQGEGSFVFLSAEQIFASDPDVIVLPTASGYHPPEELYTAPYFRDLQQLRAVKNRRVAALPWSPCNCAKRLEYPIEIMILSKVAYPERFRDIKVHEWVLEFYRQVYGVDQQTARKLRSAQWLDWMEAEDF